MRGDNVVAAGLDVNLNIDRPVGRSKTTDTNRCFAPQLGSGRKEWLERVARTKLCARIKGGDLVLDVTRQGSRLRREKAIYRRIQRRLAIGDGCRQNDQETQQKFQYAGASRE